MARGKPLTAAMVRAVKAPGKYHDGQGLGLYLRVEVNGSRFRVQRITVRGKRQEPGLGSPAVTSLAEAREVAIANKRIARAGGDPKAERRKAKAVPSFEQAARRYLDAKLPEFRNERHGNIIRRSLELHVFPVIGDIPVDAVGVNDVLRVLQPIWGEKTDTARRVRRRIEAVLSWAKASGFREGENRVRWKENLQGLLPKWTLRHFDWDALVLKSGMDEYRGPMVPTDAMLQVFPEPVFPATKVVGKLAPSCLIVEDSAGTQLRVPRRVGRPRKGEAPISSVYRLGDAVRPGEQIERRRAREQSLFRLLWLKHGVMCLRVEDLPDDDPLAQHVINIANQRYGRRNAAKT